MYDFYITLKTYFALSYSVKKGGEHIGAIELIRFQPIFIFIFKDTKKLIPQKLLVASSSTSFVI